MKNKQSNGLESLALALIFAPEPFTTLLGVGLLAVAKAEKATRVGASATHRVHRLEDYYRYRMELSDNGRLRYKMTPIREGQIPDSIPRTTNLYETDAWKHYRNRSYDYLNKKSPPNFAGLQKGLLNEVNRGINRNKY